MDVAEVVVRVCVRRVDRCGRCVLTQRGCIPVQPRREGPHHSCSGGYAADYHAVLAHGDCAADGRQGLPCSTRARGLPADGRQGLPCSTRARGLPADGRQGLPCSTRARRLCGGRKAGRPRGLLGGGVGGGAQRRHRLWSKWMLPRPKRYLRTAVPGVPIGVAPRVPLRCRRRRNACASRAVRAYAATGASRASVLRQLSRGCPRVLTPAPPPASTPEFPNPPRSGEHSGM
jgi:hypothetical protein